MEEMGVVKEKECFVVNGHARRNHDHQRQSSAITSYPTRTVNMSRKPMSRQSVPSLFKDIWSIGWEFYSSWVAAITLSFLIIYLDVAINDHCWRIKLTVANVSLGIAVSSILGSLIVFMLLYYHCNCFYELTIYYIICSSHIIISFLNFMCATIILLQRTCYESLITDQLTGSANNFIEYVLLKYDFKIAAALHYGSSLAFVYCVVNFALFKDAFVHHQLRIYRHNDRAFKLLSIK